MRSISTDDDSAVRPFVAAPSCESEWSGPQGFDAVLGEYDFVFETSWC